MRSACRKCTITAGDVYDNKNMVSWTRAYQRKIKGRPKAWAFHNYKDATRKRGTTGQFLAITRGPIVLRAVRGFSRDEHGQWNYLLDRERQIGQGHGHSTRSLKPKKTRSIHQCRNGAAYARQYEPQR